MTGCLKHAAGVLVATGALALAGAATASAQAWQTPSATLTDGAVLTITSDGATYRDPAVSLVPKLLTVPGGFVAPNMPVEFLPPDGHLTSDHEWVFHGDSNGWRISLEANPSYCLTDGSDTGVPKPFDARPLLLQPCHSGSPAQSWFRDDWLTGDDQLWSELDRESKCSVDQYNGSEMCYAPDVMTAEPSGVAEADKDGYTASQTIELFPDMLNTTQSKTATVPTTPGTSTTTSFSCPTPYLAYGADRLHPAVLVINPTGATYTVGGTVKSFHVTFTLPAGSQPVTPGTTATVGWNCIIDTNLN